MNRAFALATLPVALALLPGCVTIRSVDDGVARARIGETVKVGGGSITPLAVVEDSRCPAKVQCIQAGRLRLSVRIDGQPAELTLGQPASPAMLVEAYPDRRADLPTYPDQYRFGFVAPRR
jgi:hypothetical protein